MNSEDLVINVTMNMADAQKRIASLEDQISQMGGVSGAVQKKYLDGHLAMASGVQFHKLAVGELIGHVLHLGEMFTIAALTVKGFTTAFEGINHINADMSQLRQAVGLTDAGVNELSQGIVRAGQLSGKTFEELSLMAKTVIGETGLQGGMGSIVTSAVQMERVFGISSETFAVMAAEAVKFSGGLLTGQQIMNTFNHIVGVSGQKMTEILGTVREVGKQMQRMQGSGTGFGASFKGTSKMIAEVSANIERLHGDSTGFQDLAKGILDPHNWKELAHTMPGLAPYFQDMQRAMASGDTKTFMALLQKGGQDMVQMASGMDSVSQGATGWNNGLAQSLAAIDLSTDALKKLQGVQARSAQIETTFAQQMQQLWNNIAAPIMTVVKPAMDMILHAFTWLNMLMATNDVANYAITWGVLGTSLLVAGVAVYKLTRSFFGIGSFVGKEVAKVAEAVPTLGQKIGGGITALFRGMASGIMAIAPALVALTPAIPVILVLELGILALGAALRLATPAIHELGTVAISVFTTLGAVAQSIMPVLQTVVETIGAVISKGLDTFGTVVNSMTVMVDKMMSMKAGDLLATAGAMGVMAAAMGGLGAGFIALGAGMGLGAGGAALWAGAMKLFGAGVGTGITEIIGGLMTAFSNFQGKGLQKLTDEMAMMEAFIGHLGSLLKTLGEAGKQSDALGDGWFSDGPLTKLNKILSSDVMHKIHDMSISAHTEADVALNGFQASNQKHQGRVEELLSDILTAVKEKTPATAAQIAQPRWNPESAFSQFSSTEW